MSFRQIEKFHKSGVQKKSAAFFCTLLNFLKYAVQKTVALRS